MKTILIVDDEASLRIALRDRLKLEEGFELLEASNGKECMDIIEKEHVDLILLDISMPVMDGFEVVQKIKEMKDPKSNPIIFALSNKGDSKSISDMVSLGMFQYFVKSDHSLESIVETIKKQLA